MQSAVCVPHYRKYAILQMQGGCRVNGEFTIEYVELLNGRMPAREFVDSWTTRQRLELMLSSSGCVFMATGWKASS